MSVPARILIMLVLLTGAETAGMACAAEPEESVLQSVDAVVDGIALCRLSQGVCQLRAHKIIKDDRAGTRQPSVYRLRFKPGANRRQARAMEKAGYILMCSSFWEPRRSRIGGRFYLNRASGGYRVHTNSPWGLRTADEEAE